MLWHAYYASNYAGIICSGLASTHVFIIVFYYQLQAGRAFFIAATLPCFQIKNGMFSTGSMTVKNHTEANILVVTLRITLL